MSLHEEIVADLLDVEYDLEQPTFTWKGGTYHCVASMEQIKRQLDNGGFSIENALSLTVRLLDVNGKNTFAADIPQPQQLLEFQDQEYRIESAKVHPVGSHMRIMAVSANVGI